MVCIITVTVGVVVGYTHVLLAIRISRRFYSIYDLQSELGAMFKAKLRVKVDARVVDVVRSASDK